RGHLRKPEATKRRSDGATKGRKRRSLRRFVAPSLSLSAFVTDRDTCPESAHAPAWDSLSRVLPRRCARDRTLPPADRFAEHRSAALSYVAEPGSRRR